LNLVPELQVCIKNTGTGNLKNVTTQVTGRSSATLNFNDEDEDSSSSSMNIQKRILTDRKSVV
jgi:hypothetical protein